MSKNIMGHMWFFVSLFVCRRDINRLRMNVFNIDNSFTRELPADPVKDNYIRQVPKACFSFVNPTPCSHPVLLHVSKNLMAILGLAQKDVDDPEFLRLMSGNAIHPDSQPYAMCYGGHQFGHWAGQLGDGRAINIMETLQNGQRWTYQLKGAGKTPYSRSADGLAVLRSSVREYLCSEAMHFLGVPTTRALSLVTTGDKVLRDIMYDGNAAYENGAIVCRVAPTFLRFGNYQILAAQGDMETLKKLVDYTISYFFTDLQGEGTDLYLEWFRQVALSTMDLMTEWERVGFVHGVMNTDNMSVLGLTIDYGPYGWLENYDPDWTPNTTDAQGRRYRFGNQAQIGLWNLVQLANAVYPLFGQTQPLEKILEDTRDHYVRSYRKMMFKKLGLSDHNPRIWPVVEELKKLLQDSDMDMTLFFRQLSRFDGQNDQFLNVLKSCSYSRNFDNFTTRWNEWLTYYTDLWPLYGLDNRTEIMNATNPKYVLRNYMAQMAIDKADKGDNSLIDELYTCLKNPYDEQPEYETWFALRPDWAMDKVGCSMLSCSS